MKPKVLIFDFALSVVLSVAAIFSLRALHGNADVFADWSTCLIVNVAVGVAMLAGFVLGQLVG